MEGDIKMIKKFVVFLVLFTVLCTLSTVFAMGGPAPSPTEEVETAPTASEEALAKEQIDNLRNISVNSETIAEGYGKFVKDVYAGKRYLYTYNDIAKKELIRIAFDKNENWKLRYAAIGSLRADDLPEAFKLFRKIYEDKQERIELRRCAIQGISGTTKESKKYEAVNILIEALDDDDSHLAVLAANGLGYIKDKRAIQPLIDSVKKSERRLEKLLESGWDDYKDGTTVEDGRLYAAERALGDLKAKEAVPALIDVMENEKLNKHFLDTTIGAAVRALGDIGDESALPALEKAGDKKYLDSDMYYRIETAIKKIKKE